MVNRAGSLTLTLLLLVAMPVVAQPLAADTPSSTVAGNSFIAPAGWTLRRSGRAVILEAPESDSWIAMVDVQAKSAAAALAEAWAAYRPEGPTTTTRRPLRSTSALADKDGWLERRSYVYQVSPNERRTVSALSMRHGDQWTVRIFDVADAVNGKRQGEIMLLLDELLPKGYVRESFAGKKAHRLDAPRLAELKAFVARAQQALEVPGISLGVVQDGQVVFAGGFGVRRLGKPAPVDADTLYLIASNTKPLTTLMLGKLVDEHKVNWDTPVAQVLPAFQLADSETTGKIRVSHLLCACTGMPTNNLPWLLAPPTATASLGLEMLKRSRPTSRFGAIYQYSNPMAAAAGLVGGHVAYPELELGAAYDRAMATRVFEPLGMTRTTFDFARATRGNHARPHARDVDGRLGEVPMATDQPIVNVRPAGGAWSNVNDLLAYVKMELAHGLLPGGERYIGAEVLAARQTAQVKTSKDGWYGMGLQSDVIAGTLMVSHGGRMRGYRANVFWFPEHAVGGVVLTNADAGNVLMDAVPRKLLELLFDGRSQAEEMVAEDARGAGERQVGNRKLLSLPAPPEDLQQLAPHYRHAFLHDIRVVRNKEGAQLDFGPWQAPIAARHNPDGTLTFVSAGLGWQWELLAGSDQGKRTLTLREAQNEYVFVESP